MGADGYSASKCVTGYWKADRNVTVDLLHLIAPANSYTYTLPRLYLPIGLFETSMSPRSASHGPRQAW